MMMPPVSRNIIENDNNQDSLLRSLVGGAYAN